MEIVQIPVLQDNYVYLLHSESGETAVIDAAVSEPVCRELARRNWILTEIWNTHHHSDHVGANLELHKKFNLKIRGSAKDKSRIPGINFEHKDGDEFFFGGEGVRVFSVDGHTIGHIAFWLPTSSALFSGDTIFSLGCGKLFEGTAEQMWHSISALMALPESTMIYGSHEYTLENSFFAKKVEPENPDLLTRILQVETLRKNDRPTVPSSLKLEKATNPFLRVDKKEVQKNFHLRGEELWRVFERLRSTKDYFDRTGEFSIVR